MLDELDRNILLLLQNYKMSYPKVTKIADSLKLPVSTVHSRIRKLEELGVIEGYNAIVSPEKAGKPLVVFALIKLQYPENPEDWEFDEIIAKKMAVSSDQIEEIYSMTGDWELLVKIRAKDPDEYYRIAKECIVGSGHGKVIKVHGLFALKAIKESHTVVPAAK